MASVTNCAKYLAVIIEIVINSTPDGMTLYPAGMHCRAWGDAFGY